MIVWTPLTIALVSGWIGFMIGWLVNDLLRWKNEIIWKKYGVDKI